MSKYEFEGFDARGGVVKDQIEAKDEGHAAEILKGKGLFINQIKAVDGTPMKSVLAGGRKLDQTLPWETPVSSAPVPTSPVDKEIKKLEPVAETLIMPKPVAPPPADWRKELDRDLGAIAKVLKQFDKAKTTGLSKTAVKAAKAKATEELVAKAIASAVRKELAA